MQIPICLPVQCPIFTTRTFSLLCDFTLFKRMASIQQTQKQLVSVDAVPSIKSFQCSVLVLLSNVEHYCSTDAVNSPEFGASFPAKKKYDDHNCLSKHWDLQFIQWSPHLLGTGRTRKYPSDQCDSASPYKCNWQQSSSCFLCLHCRIEWREIFSHNKKNVYWFLIIQLCARDHKGNGICFACFPYWRGDHWAHSLSGEECDAHFIHERFLISLFSLPQKFTAAQNVSSGFDNYKYQCRMELITCPSCRIHVVIE